MDSPHAGHYNATVDLLEGNLAERRDHPYLITASHTVSYGVVVERARAFGAGLLARGLAPGDRVLICTKDCIEFVCSFWGAMRAGLVAVPISPALLPAELRVVVDDSRARAIVFDPGSERIVAAAKLDELLCIATEATAIAGAVPWPDVAGVPGEIATRASDVAFWLYTSGTTGTPKGVMHTHGNLGASRDGQARQVLAMGPGDVILSVSRMHFSYGLGNSVFVPAAVGATVIVNTAPAIPAALQAVIDVHAPTLFYGVASFWAGYVGLAAANPGPRMRAAISGGEVLRPDVLERFRARFGIPLLDSLGSTEAMYHVASNRLDDMTPGSVGRPLRGFEAQVRDADGHAVIGERGELWLRGPHMFVGYWNRPELTARTLVDGWVRTADTARIVDDRVYHEGRLDDLMKLGGNWVAPREIEQAIAAHPDVTDVAVAVVDHDTGVPVLTAFVRSPRQDPELSRELFEACRARLAGHKVPRAFELVAEFPRTVTGKLKRYLLRSGVSSSTEGLLARIWQERLSVARVSRTDNFFALGGDSLAALTILNQVSAQLGTTLPASLLFQHAGLAELAALIDRRLGAPEPEALRPRPERTGQFPTSDVQTRMWLVEQMGGRSNTLEELVLHGPLDPAALERAWARLVTRHPALQVTFHGEAGGVVQRLAPRPAATVERADLADLPADQRAAACARLALAARLRRFDLACWPPFSATLVRLDPQAHVLVLAVPHILIDRWSADIVFRDLAELYRAELTSTAPALPALPLDQIDDVLWRRTATSHLEFWKAALAGAPQALPLFSAGSSQATGNLAFQLDDALVRRLRERARDSAASFYHVVLAGFFALLHRYTEAGDIVVGTSVHNRHDDALSQVVGCFMDHVPVRARLAPRSSFAALLAEVRDFATSAFSHYVPLGVLLGALELTRHAEHDPLFQVTFNLVRRAPPPVFPGCRVERRVGSLEIDRLYLNLNLLETDDHVVASLDYAMGRFEPAMAEQLAAHYVALLAAAVAEPDRAIEDLPMMPDDA
ncbi:MAG TPA: AMP-binding protein [Kofleriaceae bacterium]